MDNEQKFQKPWQIALLKVHARIEKVVEYITRPLAYLHPNTAIFVEQPKPQLRTVK